MAKVKSDGHIWCLVFNPYVCPLFHGNRTIFGPDTANSIFDLEIQGQGHNENRPKSNQVMYKSGPLILPKMKEIWKLFRSYCMNKDLWPAAAAAAVAAAAYEPVQKHKSHPRYTGVT